MRQDDPNDCAAVDASSSGWWRSQCARRAQGADCRAGDAGTKCTCPMWCHANSSSPSRPSHISFPACYFSNFTIAFYLFSNCLSFNERITGRQLGARVRQVAGTRTHYSLWCAFVLRRKAFLFLNRRIEISISAAYHWTHLTTSRFEFRVALSPLFVVSIIFTYLFMYLLQLAILDQRFRLPTRPTCRRLRCAISHRRRIRPWCRC